VIELIPPYVETELGGPLKKVPPGAPKPVPLATFIAETMNALAGDADEVAIGDAKYLSSAIDPAAARKIFDGLNR
jgi:short-subunit dehydrogenase involved in D-alanine esterification of teichoic acids